MRKKVYFDGYGAYSKNNYVYVNEVIPTINTNITPEIKEDIEIYKGNKNNFLTMRLDNNRAIAFNCLNLSFNKQRIYINDKEIELLPKQWHRVIIIYRDGYVEVNGKEILQLSNKQPININIKESDFIVFGIKEIKDFYIHNNNEIVEFLLPMFGPVITPNQNQNNSTNVKCKNIGCDNNIKITNTKPIANINNKNHIEICCSNSNSIKSCNINLFNNNKIYINNSSPEVGVINIIARNNNTIKAEGKIDEYCVLLDNNYCENMDLSISDDFNLFSSKGLFDVTTKIIEPSKEGDKHITVEKTDYMLKGNLIGFMSQGKAFVYRQIHSIVGNKIYFKEKLKKGEETFIDGVVFCNCPVEHNGFKTKTEKPTKKYNRRFYIKDLPPESMLLRDIKIGDFFTKINYIDDVTHLLITNDITDSNIDANVDVIVEPYKFINSVSFTIGNTLPNIYINQKLTINNKQFTVIGFNGDSNKILFKETDANFIGELATTEPVSKNNLSVPNIIKVKPIHFKKYDSIVYIVTETELNKNSIMYMKYNFKKYYIKNIKETYISNNGSYTYIIEFESPIYDPFINNKKIIGKTIFSKRKIGEKK